MQPKTRGPAPRKPKPQPRPPRPPSPSPLHARPLTASPSASASTSASAMHLKTRGPASRSHKRARAAPPDASRTSRYLTQAFKKARLLPRLLPGLPRPQIVCVSNRDELAVAFYELARCNVFGMCVSGRAFSARRAEDLRCAVFVRGEMHNPPALLTVAGVNVVDTRPGPRRASLGPGEWEGDVFIFDLNKLLLQPECVEELQSGLAPLLADPEKLIIGADIEQGLRTLACAYANSVPCFGGTVRGVREVGLLAGETTCRSLRALTALYAGFDLGFIYHVGVGRCSPNFAKPHLSDSVRALPAKRARAAVMVYLGAGAQAFASEEQAVDLGLVSVYLCRKCGEASLEFRASPWCACGGWQALGCASTEKRNLERWLSRVEVPASDLGMRELYGFARLEACERLEDTDRARIQGKRLTYMQVAQKKEAEELKVPRFSGFVEAPAEVHERGSSDAGKGYALHIEDYLLHIGAPRATKTGTRGRKIVESDSSDAAEG